jgi:hypothetical protein
MLHTFLNSELVAGELLANCFDCFTMGKETPSPTKSEDEWSRELTCKPDRSVHVVTLHAEGYEWAKTFG